MCNMSSGCRILPPISSPQSLLGSFAPPGRCAASNFPQKGLILLCYWLSCDQLALKTLHAPCGSLSWLLAPLQFLTQLLVAFAGCSQKPPGPAACLCLLGRSRPSSGASVGKKWRIWLYIPFNSCPCCMKCFVATAWDRRGWVSPLEVREGCCSPPA